MSVERSLLLFAAGLAGGIVTAVVGGASLITFPALLAAGLPPVVANASNTVALTPGNVAAALADLGRRPRWDRFFLAMSLVAVAGSGAPALVMMAGALVGGFVGGRLVRVLPPRVVRAVVIAVGAALTAVYAWRY
jgi:uncharacterized membrane protein YfcA